MYRFEISLSNYFIQTLIYIQLQPAAFPNFFPSFLLFLNFYF